MATNYIFIVLLLCLVALSTARRRLILTSPPVTDWGEWGNFEHCSTGTYAQGFQLKTLSNLRRWNFLTYMLDDTSLNGIRIFCGNPTRPVTRKLTSTQGDEGKWGKVFSCFPGVLTGFQLRAQSYVGGAEWLKPEEVYTLFYKPQRDDTATNNIRFWCSNSADPNYYLEGDGNGWGDWSTAQHCTETQAICGIRTQVEAYQYRDDDTALNNVSFECCEYQGRKVERFMRSFFPEK